MPMSVHDALEAWSQGRMPIERALELTGCADADELLRACDSSDVQRPDTRGGIAMPITHLSDEEMGMILAADPPPECDAPADPAQVRWRIEDGTGCSSRVELYVRVLVGTERSTIIVSDPITGRAHFNEVVPHGSETASAGAAVEGAVRKQMNIAEVIAMVRGAPDVPPDPGDEW